MKTENSKLTGIFFALIAALISGISIFYNKSVVVKGIDPLIFNIIKNGGVGVILSLILIKKSGFSGISKNFRDNNLWLIGLIGGSLPFVLFFTGLKNVDAINANLIQKTLFVWVALMAIPFLKEKINPVQIIGYLLVVYANFATGAVANFRFTVPVGMIFAATILWSVENIIAKKSLKSRDSGTVAWGRMFFGTVFLVILATATGKASLIFSIKGNQLLPVAGSILLLTAYVASWYKALKLAPASLVTAVLVLATPVTNLLSSRFISPNPGNFSDLNTGLIILGVALISAFYLHRKPDAQTVPDNHR